MRFVQVMIPSGKREAVRGVLDEEGIDYALTDETSGREYTAVATFLLPTAAVEPVLDKLREVGLERDASTVVLEAETVVGKRFEELEEAYETDEVTERIALDELVAEAEGMIPDLPVFVVMTALSAVVATAGVLLDSPAVVVGSMVIAPLIGPAMATSVGTVSDDADLFGEGLRLQVLGGFLAILSAAAFALALHATKAVPLTASEVFALHEVRERLLPDMLSLAIAVAAGVAGALSLSSALVGVMIAAALVPPTAVVGIGLAWGRPMAVVGSVVLVLVNFISINLAALAVFWYEGYRPRRWFRLEEARTTLFKRAAVLGVAIVVLSVFLVGVTYSAYWSASVEATARQQVTHTLEERGLSLVSLSIRYDHLPIRTPTTAVVTVGYPVGTDPPTSLAADLAARLNPVPPGPFGLHHPDPISVRVHYVAVECQPGPCTRIASPGGASAAGSSSGGLGSPPPAVAASVRPSAVA
ncbi:MAG: TIGR00341 family protein [Salinigranum sp.]